MNTSVHERLSLETCDERMLIEQALAGSGPAFEAIMRRYNRLLFRTARSILGHDSDAEEVLQEAYLKAWQALASFRGEAKLGTWLARIVANQALAKRRLKAAPVIALQTILADADEASDHHAALADSFDQQPEQKVMRAQWRRLVEAHIDRLPEAFRVVFVLRAVEELNVEEVASALNIPEATVRTRYFRARSLLRESLAQEIDVALEEVFSFDGARCDRIVAGVLAKAQAAGLSQG